MKLLSNDFACDIFFFQDLANALCRDRLVKRFFNHPGIFFQRSIRIFENHAKKGLQSQKRGDFDGVSREAEYIPFSHYGELLEVGPAVWYPLRHLHAL
jgi:hypothetical protein